MRCKGIELGNVIEEARLKVWQTMGRLGSGGPGKPEARRCKVNGKTEKKSGVRQTPDFECVVNDKSHT